MLVILPCIGFWIIFRNIVKKQFGFWNTLLAITLLIVLGYIFSILLNLEFLSNIIVVVVLSIFAYKKSGEIIALSVFYAILAMLISMVIGNITGTIVMIMYSTTVSGARENII